MVELGVRVEFYEQVSAVGEPSKGYLGALDRTDGYRAVAVPAVGTYVMAASLRVTDRESAVGFPAPNRLPVRAVEHHLTPVRDDAVPSWWNSYEDPGATVVLHVALGSVRGGELLRRQIRQFVADGWECSGPKGSELWEYGLEAWRALRQSSPLGLS